MMNEVSIIINGVRYDAVRHKGDGACANCDLRELCHNIPSIVLCEVFACELTVRFKKSDKSFEK